MDKRVVLAYTLAATLVFSLASHAAPVEISFMEVGDPAKQEAFDKYYALWQDQHPEITVNYFQLGYGESFDKIKTLWVAGDPFDVSPMYNPRYDSTFVEADALVSLDPFVLRDGINADDFLPGIFSTWDQFDDGTRVGLPYAYTGEVLWYNPDLFDQAGLAHPPSDWKDTGWTWTDFVNAARRITRDVDGDGTPDVWGLANIPSLSLLPFLWDQEIFNEDFSEFILASQDGANAIQRGADLALVDGVAPKPGTTQENLFQSGLAGMTFQGAWAMGEARYWDVSWNWAVQPMGTRRATIMYIDHLYIAKNNRDEAAWEWVKFLVTNPEVQIIYAGEGNGKIPALREAAYTWVNEMLAQMYPGLHLHVLLDGIMYDIGGRTGEAFPNWQRVAPIIHEAYDRILRGEASAYQILTEVKPVIDAILRENR